MSEAISNVIQENIDTKDNIADAYSAIFEKDATVNIPIDNESALNDENLPQTIRNIKTFQTKETDELHGHGDKIFAERGTLGDNEISNNLNEIKNNNGIYFLKKEYSYENTPINSPFEDNNIYCLQIIKIKDTEVLQRFFIINDTQIEVYERIYQSLSWSEWKLATKEDISNKVNSLENPSDETYPTTQAVSNALDKLDANIFKLRVLPSNDLNMAKQEGYYFLKSSSSYENAPFENSFGLLEVFVMENKSIFQRIITLDCIYIRLSNKNQEFESPTIWYSQKIQLDKTLTQDNVPADAKAVGDVLDTKVNKTQTIAGISLQDDISANQLFTSLELNKYNLLEIDNAYFDTGGSNAKSVNAATSMNKIYYVRASRYGKYLGKLLYFDSSHIDDYDELQIWLHIDGRIRFRTKHKNDTKWGDWNTYLTSEEVNTLLTAKENTANKVTSLSSSSTDDQYPTAKCVYDMIGDIGTALDTLNDNLAEV